ncbi:hypothetical protein M6C35_001999 [Vibrio metschnikovii]|nr:hypothetical protein [Vibrio metschnikovii]
MKTPNQEDLNLKAHRCPSAMTRVRIGLQSAMRDKRSAINVFTIEPMCLSHIKAFLTDQAPTASIIAVESTPITDEMKNSWLSSPEGFDEDDFDMAMHWQCISIAL